jgi:hypothetical protein
LLQRGIPCEPARDRSPAALPLLSESAACGARLAPASRSSPIPP